MTTVTRGCESTTMRHNESNAFVKAFQMRENECSA